MWVPGAWAWPRGRVERGAWSVGVAARVRGAWCLERRRGRVGAWSLVPGAWAWPSGCLERGRGRVERGAWSVGGAVWVRGCVVGEGAALRAETGALRRGSFEARARALHMCPAEQHLALERHNSRGELVLLLYRG